MIHRYVSPFNIRFSKTYVVATANPWERGKNAMVPSSVCQPTTYLLHLRYYLSHINTIPTERFNPDSQGVLAPWN